MHFSFTPHILPFVGAACVLAALLTVAWSNRRDPVARWFAATLGALLIWAVGYVFEMVAVEVESKVLFANIQFLGVATVSLCWWEMVRRYLGFRRVPRAITTFIWTVAASTVLIAFVDPAGLFRGEPYIQTTGAPFPVLHADYGAWYYGVMMPVIGLLNLTVLILLGRAIVRSPRFYRPQYVLLFAALLLPLIGTVLYVFDLPPWSDYNLTVAITGFSGLLLAVGLFRWRLFDMVPLARDLVVEGLGDGVIVADGGGRIVDLNRSAEMLFGVERAEVMGLPVKEVLAGYPVLVEMLEQRGVSGGVLPGHREMVAMIEGSKRYYSISGSPVTSRHKEPLGQAVVLHEVTERVRLFEQARELANKDDLTGLVNRRHFFELTSREFDRARRYGGKASFLMIDVDHFKLVNDTFGHRTGDLVLRELARVCRNALRSSDVLSRLGGEEFAVLLPEVDLVEAVQAADRLREAVAAMTVGAGPDGRNIPVTISVGATEFQATPAEGTDTVDTVLDRADKALYQAKDLGRNMTVAAEGPPVRATPGLRAVI